MTKRTGITPIDNIARRPAEAGRIRLGKKKPTKTGKQAPARVDTLRFTSPHRDVLDELQAHVGGDVVPWVDPKASPRNQFELISNVQEIPVYLVPDGISCWYEMWSGGGCQRRCNGVTAEVPVQAGEDSYLGTAPCLCVEQNVRLCEPYTRLQVVLPQIRFRGVWRLDTKSWNAQAELPGMFDLIMQANERGGMVQAMLGREIREKMVNGRLSSFVLPTLSVQQTFLQIQQGMADAQALAAGPTPMLQLVAAPTQQPPPELQSAADQDDPIEAMIVDEELLVLEDGLRNDARQFNLDPDRFLLAMQRAVAGNELDAAKARFRTARGKMAKGELVPVGFTRDGSIDWGR